MAFGKPLSFWKTLFQVLLWVCFFFEWFSCFLVWLLWTLSFRSVFMFWFWIVFFSCIVYWSFLELKASSHVNSWNCLFTMFQVGSVSLSPAKVRNRFHGFEGSDSLSLDQPTQRTPRANTHSIARTSPWASADSGVMVSDEFRHRWKCLRLEKLWPDISSHPSQILMKVYIGFPRYTYIIIFQMLFFE